MKCKKVVIVIFVVAICWFLTGRVANCAERRIGVGNKIPEFSAFDTSGNLFEYKHGNGKVLMVIFLSSKHKNSTRAAVEIEKIISKLTGQEKHLSIVIAVDDPNNQTYFISDPDKSDPNAPQSFLHFIKDTEYKLWGKFGIIATPTVIIADSNDTVLWVKAGHGYDFAPAVQARLNQALGIAQEIDPNEAGHVRTVINATVAARVTRHLQMAKMLQEKGRIESAITQMKKARELDPNSVELALEIGNLLCSIGQSKSALEILDGVQTGGYIEKSKLLLITGWANRQMGNFDESEKLLLEAIRLNPKSGRAFFELGQVQQAKGEVQKAMLTYYRALTLVFGKESN